MYLDSRARDTQRLRCSVRLRLRHRYRRLRMQLKATSKRSSQCLTFHSRFQMFEKAVESSGSCRIRAGPMQYSSKQNKPTSVCPDFGVLMTPHLSFRRPVPPLCKAQSPEDPGFRSEGGALFATKYGSIESSPRAESHEVRIFLLRGLRREIIAKYTLVGLFCFEL
jgi:hypothetical protein